MRYPTLSIACLTALLAASPAGAKQTAERCAVAKAAATAQLTAARVACLRTALAKNQAVDASCVQKATDKFIAKNLKIEGKGSCRPTGGDGDVLAGFVDTLAARLEGSLAAPPAQGALRLSWTILNSGDPIACNAVNGATGLSVDLTPMGGGNPITQSLPCNDTETGDVVGIPLGTYLLSVSIVNDQQQAIATSSTQSVTLDANCDVIVSGNCGKLVPLQFAIL